MRAASPIASILLLTSCSFSEVAPQAGAGAPDAPDPAEAQAAQDQMAFDVAESLVTEVGPRFAGSDGYRKAVEWALLKLTVLGFDNVHTEPVTVPDWGRGDIAVELLAPRAQPLEAVALGGSVGTPAAGVEGAVLAVPTLEALDKVPAAQVKGRIVFFTGRMERTRDGAGYGTAVAVRRSGPANAARKGAKAVLIRSVGTDPQGRPHTGTTKYEDAPKIPAAALAGAAADALDHALAGGKPVRVRVKIGAREKGTLQAANVIGEIPGATPEIVLLGAHLDSWDTTPGANDDAAGVGIVIAAAHRLLGTDPRRTIRIVLFANEEYGLSGAKAYVQAHASELDRHAVALEADTGSGAVYRINGGVAAGDWPWVQALAQRLQLEVGANGQDGHADIGELRKAQVPEIIPGQDASAYFDVHHTAGDTVDTLDRAGLKQASEVYAALAQAAAGRAESFGRAPLVPARKP